MKRDVSKKQVLDRIRENITRKGHHVYIVSGGAKPRFAYTIGVSESIGVELVLAGAIFYLKTDVIQIVNSIVTQLKAQPDCKVFEINGQGLFTLRKVDVSWVASLMLGALDYYKVGEISALQIVPDRGHWTIDIPDLSKPWSATTEPVWQWMHQPWTYPVPEGAMVATNLVALRGGRITEAMRWDEDEWEIFAGNGSNVEEENMRVVPLGTLVATDESLVPVVNLGIGEGLLRDAAPDSEWRTWRKKETESNAPGNGMVQ